MDVFTFDFESTSSVIPAAKKFNAYVIDGHKLIPMVAPLSVRSHEILEGNGGPGTIKMINFVEGYEKHRIDAIDYANFSYSYTVIEGAVLSNMIEKISYEIKIVPTPDGGSILKKTSKYHTRGYQQIRGEEVQACHSRAQTHFKAVEDYLLVNPHLYK